MQVLAFLQTPQVLVSSQKNSKKRAPVYYDLIGSLPFSLLVPPQGSLRNVLDSVYNGRSIRTLALNVGTGTGGYEERHENDKHILPVDRKHIGSSSKLETPHHQFPLPLSIALVLCACALVYSLIAFTEEPSSLLTALAKSGFAAAFSLIFVSEIADKTFFIDALLAMQHEQIMHTGSFGINGALKTIVSVIIGRLFHIANREYAAVTLLLFFGLQSIREMSVKLSPIEVLGESFSLVVFAHAGCKSVHLIYRRTLYFRFLLLILGMERPLNAATMALGAAHSPLGVASGAISGHLLATFIAVLGGSFLSHYISEKLSGYICGALFLVFAVATFFGVL